MKHTKLWTIVVAILILFGTLAVGLRLGYNQAIKDARLMNITSNGYIIGYGDEAHGYQCHEYIGSID